MRRPGRWSSAAGSGGRAPEARPPRPGESRRPSACGNWVRSCAAWPSSGGGLRGEYGGGGGPTASSYVTPRSSKPAHHHLHELLGLLRRRQGRRGRRPGHVQLHVLGPPFRCAVPRVHVVNRHGVAVSHSITSASRTPGTSPGRRRRRVDRLVAAGAQRAPGLVGRTGPRRPSRRSLRRRRGGRPAIAAPRLGWRLWQGQPHTRCLTRGPGPQPSSRRCNE